MRPFFFPFCLFLLVVSGGPAWPAMEDHPSVRLQGLDKSTARTTTFEAKVGSTIQYGPLFIRIQACRKASPIEQPESAAFLQIWEVPHETKKSEWVFSGWMYASSPALSAMDHPVYDIWVLDCFGREEPPQEKSGDTESGENGENTETGQDSADQEALAPVEEEPVLSGEPEEE